MKRKSQRRLKKLLEENMPEGHAYFNGYLRVDKKYSIDLVLQNIGEHTLEFDGYPVKMWSLRYQTFRKSLFCAVCGKEGKHFRLEKHALHANIERNSFHFNLYTIDNNGNELLMTKDHIIPKAKGGRNHISNLQTMCTICNRNKGS